MPFTYTKFSSKFPPLTEYCALNSLAELTPGSVFSSASTPPIELGIMAIERAKRKLEAGRDVVVLLDSLTRLGRAFNNSKKYASSGRTMSGGLDAKALEVPMHCPPVSDPLRCAKALGVPMHCPPVSDPLRSECYTLY